MTWIYSTAGLGGRAGGEEGGDGGPVPGQRRDVRLDAVQRGPHGRDDTRAELDARWGAVGAGQQLGDGPGVEPGLQQRADLVDAARGLLVVLPVPVAGACRPQQALLLVVAQRPGRRATAPGELTDPHAACPPPRSS